jgi:hypothetical protein
MQNKDVVSFLGRVFDSARESIFTRILTGWRVLAPFASGVVLGAGPTRNRATSGEIFNPADQSLKVSNAALVQVDPAGLDDVFSTTDVNGKTSNIEVARGTFTSMPDGLSRVYFNPSAVSDVAGLLRASLLALLALVHPPALVATASGKKKGIPRQARTSGDYKRDREALGLETDGTISDSDTGRRLAQLIAEVAKEIGSAPDGFFYTMKRKGIKGGTETIAYVCGRDKAHTSTFRGVMGHSAPYCADCLIIGLDKRGVSSEIINAALGGAVMVEKPKETAPVKAEAPTTAKAPKVKAEQKVAA